MEALGHSILLAVAITAFVVAMMTLVEAIHVYRGGIWTENLARHPKAQVLSRKERKRAGRLPHHSRG